MSQQKYMKKNIYILKFYANKILKLIPVSCFKKYKQTGLN